MRRQVGADYVDIDTIVGYCRYSYERPVLIEYEDIEEAVADASYTLTKITLLLRGDVVRQACEICAEEVSVLVIPETGQRFELVEDASPEESVLLQGCATDWLGDHPRLELHRHDLPGDVTDGGA